MLYTIGIIIILSLLFWHIAVYGDNNIYNILASLPFPDRTEGNNNNKEDPATAPGVFRPCLSVQCKYTRFTLSSHF